ncbi:RNA-directed DNA polymerase from mobile element jockey [Plakobranchus ocellatus]|uniref:RNA-directed DNA polymerase from mobile element jockey n=1 Tax=Plakobranchus ocellatus TaxID=259542 RepID=A0AAV3YNE6_9GAST|nr:RNA-directed DNA polymerase from mobile element jockey [Plakobranchus ocellatus]
MRCYRCKRYGHGKDATVCVRYGKCDHVERDCRADPHCINCQGDHEASSKTCPRFLKEKAIRLYKAENGGTCKGNPEYPRSSAVLTASLPFTPEILVTEGVKANKRLKAWQGEAALLIRNRTGFSEIDLNTGLHAAAATISLEKTLTICSLYLPRSTEISKKPPDELFEQLLKPCLVMRNFNLHSPACGDSRTDGRGRMLEEFIAKNDLIIPNSGEQTFVHSAYHSTSAIDLAVASPTIAAECYWAAYSYTCGSDHFPTILNFTSNFTRNFNSSTFHFKKANWNRFGDLCRLPLDGSVVDVEQFTLKLLDAARSFKLFYKGTKFKTKVPWFTQNCRQALQGRKRAQRKCFTAHSLENLINLKKERSQHEIHNSKSQERVLENTFHF